LTSVGKGVEVGKYEGVGRYMEEKDFGLLGLRKKIGGKRMKVVSKN